MHITTNSGKTASKMCTGDILTFGKYDWEVLDAQKDRALIITEHIIDQRPYHDAYTEVTWADCALRKYLNEAFYGSFTPSEQARIITVINKNPDNTWYGTNGGNDTEDSIFLLNMEEAVCAYFGDSSSKLYDRRKIKDIGSNGKTKIISGESQH